MNFTQTKKPEKKGTSEEGFGTVGSGKTASMTSMMPPTHQLKASSIPSGTGSKSNKEGPQVPFLPQSELTAAFSDEHRHNVLAYEIGVFVDQPGTGGDRDTYEIRGGRRGRNFQSGHSWIMIRMIMKEGSVEDRIVERYLGFYPNFDVNPLLGATVGIGAVADDEGKGYEVSESKYVNEAQFVKVLEYIDSHADSQYDLDNYNCTDFAIEAAAAGGLILPDTHGTWPGGGGSSPGHLGEDIREIQERRRAEAAAKKKKN